MEAWKELQAKSPQAFGVVRIHPFLSPSRIFLFSFKVQNSDRSIPEIRRFKLQSKKIDMHF